MIINNVRLILENELVAGSLEMRDGLIASFSETPSRQPDALDGEGGYLLPGLVELHTDNLDKFFAPRPKVDWPAHSAMSSHDALMVASGITTVLDAIGVGDVRDGGHRLDNLSKMIDAIRDSNRKGLNRAEHRLHLRCELPHHATLPLFEALMGTPELSLVSLMDHSPGQRQYASLEKYREYYQGKYALNDQEMDAFEHEQLTLAAEGLLDILSSDYYPASLLDAAFRLAADERNPLALPQAVALVTRNPACALGLTDRGVIAEGRRADLVLAHTDHGHPHIRHVWAQGRQVY